MYGLAFLFLFSVRRRRGTSLGMLRLTSVAKSAHANCAATPAWRPPAVFGTNLVARPNQNGARMARESVKSQTRMARLQTGMAHFPTRMTKTARKVNVEPAQRCVKKKQRNQDGARMADKSAGMLCGQTIRAGLEPEWRQDGVEKAQ